MALAKSLAPDVRTRLEQESLSSLENQRKVEAADDKSFAAYLQDFYAQYDAL